MLAFLFRRLLLSLPPPQPQLCRSLSSSSPLLHFLTDSCGLSPSAAATAASSLRLLDPSLSNPRSVLSLLQSHNFSSPQIAALISHRPSLLSSPSLLRPKLRLLSSSTAPHLLPSLVSANPGVLHRSLHNHIKPALDLLRSFATPDDLLLAVRRNRWLLTCNFRKTLLPNITLLLTHGVPIPHVSKLLTAHPNTLMQPSDHFADAVAIVERFGMKPDLSLFIHAVRAMGGMSPPTRSRRLEQLRKWGWSEDEIGAAFRRAPLFVLVSDDKMKQSMNFLINTVGFEMGDISLQPKLLMYSLEKRMMPRFAVYRELEKKGLVDGKVVRWMFICSDSEFLNRYLVKYSKKLPGLMEELLEVYHCEFDVGKVVSESVCGEVQREVAGVEGGIVGGVPW